MTERLQKFLASAGVASRRKSEDLINAGRIMVNGKVAELGSKVSAEDVVEFDGKIISKKAKMITFMLNKPVGYISSLNDELGRKTVMDLVPKVDGLHPVGRLDKNSQGLLLLSNNGDLTLQMTHPRFEHEKEYRIWTKQGTVSPNDLDRLEHGVQLEDGWARAVAAKPAKDGCILVLNEGRKRQVRRMLAELGYKVIKLERTRIANLRLKDLKIGQYRVLTAQDYKVLGYTQKQEGVKNSK